MDLHVCSGAYLPHWTKEGGSYHVRFRLGDSLPQETLRGWIDERKEITEQTTREGRGPSKSEQERLDELHSEKIEKYLDAGYGACWLKRDDVAKIVADTLWVFNEERYQLLAWCIMPNHVHVVLQPMGGYSLHDILHSWKSYTSKEANKILGRIGTFWQREYFDHLLRNHEYIERAVEYVWRNPDEAGFRNWKWRWRIDFS